ncbi:WRKY DNA binding domain containing protein [Rhynchospora pubera]|uniref:WRKY DNA binding domain containing protein n=1 Tax=Rhynchospora pubera TaxID=906938 RepID=A0AAV8DLK8_9POAL|nr:WRKY DNA binding domain containing protein [Rhynchospora pubera]
MISTREATQALNYNLAIKELEKSCELTEMLRAHVGNGTDLQFGHIFEEISRTLTMSRDIVSKVAMPHSSEGAKTNKRKRDDEFKDRQRRKYNSKMMKLTPTPHQDGFQWRKYGEKTILNKKHPRCYFRCTYSQDRKCMATKQVQQYNDEYPPLFEVIYFDEHTCSHVIPNSKSTNSKKILDFSSKSITKPSLPTIATGCRREYEEATLVSCLTDVIKGYNSEISENSNEGHKAHNTSNEFSVSIDDDISSIESTLLREDEFSAVHDLTRDLEWLEQNDIKFLLETLSPGNFL